MVRRKKFLLNMRKVISRTWFTRTVDLSIIDGRRWIISIIEF